MDRCRGGVRGGRRAGGSGGDRGGGRVTPGDDRGGEPGGVAGAGDPGGTGRGVVCRARAGGQGAAGGVGSADHGGDPGPLRAPADGQCPECRGHRPGHGAPRERLTGRTQAKMARPTGRTQDKMAPGPPGSVCVRRADQFASLIALITATAWSPWSDEYR
ncbi:hypothetical protein B5181_00125 [Streptomyces sp. 4F]|nr:hypothetical protein B5181_00125 [Streptomyces sp. 4F]